MAGYRKGRELGEGYTYVALGITFAGGIILFAGLGFGLDRLLGTMPFLTIAGTLAGAVLSFLYVLAKLNAGRSSTSGPPEEK